MKIPSILTLKRVMQRRSAMKKHLPHHPVYNKNKSEKFLMVFDAALECNGNSLNKALVTGSDLLKSLVGTILPFHNYRVAFSADIEAVYHQVHMNPANLMKQLLHVSADLSTWMIF